MKAETSKQTCRALAVVWAKPTAANTLVTGWLRKRGHRENPTPEGSARAANKNTRIRHRPNRPLGKQPELHELVHSNGGTRTAGYLRKAAVKGAQVGEVQRDQLRGGRSTQQVQIRSRRCEPALARQQFGGRERRHGHFSGDIRKKSGLTPSNLAGEGILPKSC